MKIPIMAGNYKHFFSLQCSVLSLFVLNTILIIFNNFGIDTCIKNKSDNCFLLIVYNPTLHIFIRVDRDLHSSKDL